MLRPPQAGDERPVVLVADDDHELRSLLVHLLEDEGYDVLVAADGLDALGYDVLVAADGLDALGVLASPAPVDVLVTDHRMPRCTGIELVERMRASGSRLGVVLLTSFPDRTVEAEARRLGAHAVVCKPFPLGDLLQAVHELAHPTWRGA